MRPIFWVMLLSALVLTAAPLAAAPAMKDWTWLVFINADNNLDPYGVKDQKEMAQVGSNDHLNIVTQIDRAQGPATRNFIARNSIVQLENLGEIDMGDWRVLAAFVKEMTAAYPARHYALVIWNHGSGWKGHPTEATKGISYDDQSGNHITTGQLALAMGEIRGNLGRNLDILAFDACLMQMVEILWAVRGNCDFVVGSEQTVPGDGYPYRDIFGGFSPGMSPADFCRHLVKVFDVSYSGGSQGYSPSTLSAVECAGLGAMRTAVDGLARALMAKDFSHGLQEALDQATHFVVPQYVDLGHLADLAAAKIDDPAVKAAAGRLKATLQAAVVANGAHGEVADSQGLSIFFPPIHGSYMAKYGKLAWAQETLWDEMLADFHQKTVTNSVLQAMNNGETCALAEFVRNSDPGDRDLNRHLVSKVNFAAFAEGGMDPALQNSVRNLLRELSAR